MPKKKVTRKTIKKPAKMGMMKKHMMPGMPKH